MEKRRRVILYGKSVIVGSVGASLRDVPGLELIALAPPLPKAKDLGALAPDAIIFDLEAAHPEAALSLLRERPGLLLVGVDPGSDELIVVSSHHRRAVAVADLLEVIGREAATAVGKGSMPAMPPEPDRARAGQGRRPMDKQKGKKGVSLR